MASVCNASSVVRSNWRRHVDDTMTIMKFVVERNDLATFVTNVIARFAREIRRESHDPMLTETAL